MITHRCEGSLKNKVSIRYTIEHDFIKRKGDYMAWRLFKNELHYDSFDNYYLSHISEIKYCPYCGEELI